MEVKKLETVIWCKFCGTVAKGTVEDAIAHKEGKCLEKSNVWRRWKSRLKRVTNIE